MKPIGNVFHIFSDVGQRLLWSPLDLAERHRNHATERTFKSIPQDQVRNTPYNRPGIIKTVNDGFVYYTVAEKIQDANLRAALSVHTMVFPLDELMEDGGALLPPESREEYRALGLPSELHSQSRRLSDIQRVIDQYVAEADVSTRLASPGWNTRELNWLLSNPRSIISDAADGFSAEAAIAGLLAGLPPLVSSGLSFAAGYIPNTGNFHLAAQSASANLALSRGISTFKSGSSFQAAVESSPTEDIMASGQESEFHLALTVIGRDPLDVLSAFRNGIHREETGETIIANLISQALSEDGRSQWTLGALERSIGTIKEFSEGDKEIICKALEPLTNRPNSVGGQAGRLISALAGAASAAPRPAIRNIQAEFPSQEVASEDIEKVQRTLEESIRIVKEAPEDGVETVRSSARRFTELVIAGGPGVPKGGELADLVQGLWWEIAEWVKKGGKKKEEHRRRIRQAFGYRENPGAPSLFDDLIHIKRQASYREEHDKTLKAYDKLLIDTLVTVEKRRSRR